MRLNLNLNKKKLLIGLSLVVLVITTGVITVLILSRVLANNSSSPEVSIPSPTDIIKQYQKEGEVNELGTLYAKKENPSAGPEIINYTADKSYMIYIKSADTIQFEQKDKAIQTNSSAVKGNSEAFLTKNNLQKKSVATASSSLFSLFDSEQTACQLFDLPSNDKNGATLTLSCVKKSDINDRYTTINKLLDLYSGSKSDIANPTGIALRTINEGNKTLSTLDIYGIKSDSGATSLIFAAIDNSWEYIGKRAISNGETVIDNSLSAELKEKVNDSKYGDFLKNNVK